MSDDTNQVLQDKQQVAQDDNMQSDPQDQTTTEQEEVISENSENQNESGDSSPAKPVPDDNNQAPADAEASENAEPPVQEETAPAPVADEAPSEEGATPNAEETPGEDTEPSNDEAQRLEDTSSDDPNAKWYVVHTYSGHENKVATALKQRVESEHLEHKILDVIVPTQDKIEIRSGKKSTVKEKIFPGYILVKMILDDEAWVLVRTTAGVTSFVGAQNKPTPVRDEEVEAIVQFVEQKEPVFKAAFSVGEAVKINDGPFSDFLGSVESIDEAKGKVKVLVSIFGRETPVELDFLQISKI